jgi:hypothetical protein
MVTSTGSVGSVIPASGRTLPTIPRTRLPLLIAALVCRASMPESLIRRTVSSGGQPESFANGARGGKNVL